MYKKNLNTLLIATLFLGVFLVINSKSWFSAWVGLELNLLSFLPMIMMSQSPSGEASMKYFLIQAMASLTLLQFSFLWSMSTIFPLLILIILSLKLGLAPFHFWLPIVAENLSWMMNLILLTVQKIGPFFLFFNISSLFPKLLMIISMTSAIYGALGGFNEFFLRKLLAFSSINHMGWIVFSMLFSATIWIFYLLIYIIISSSLMIILNLYKLHHLTQNNMKMYQMMFCFVLFLSLGGFPPLLGFAPKWTVIMEGISFSFVMTFILIMSSVVTLFYYIRSSMIVSTLNSWTFKYNMNMKYNSAMASLLWFNITGSLFYIFIWSINSFTL